MSENTKSLAEHPVYGPIYYDVAWSARPSHLGFSLAEVQACPRPGLAPKWSGQMIPVRKPLSISCRVHRSLLCLSKGQGSHHCCIHLVLLPEKQRQLKYLATCSCETSPTVEPESMLAHHLCKNCLQTKQSSLFSTSTMPLKPEWSHCAWLMWGSKNPDTSACLLVKPCWLAQMLPAFKGREESRGCGKACPLHHLCWATVAITWTSHNLCVRQLLLLQRKDETRHCRHTASPSHNNSNSLWGCEGVSSSLSTVLSSHFSPGDCNLT